jgi:FAD/FMN-containing dehydrogenase
MAFTEVAYKALQDVVGDENVTNDPALCQAYSRVQWLPGGVLQREKCGLNMRPACVVMPGSTEEVQSIIKIANRYSFPFIPRGSGFTFQAFPTQGGTIVTSCPWCESNLIDGIDGLDSNMKVEDILDLVVKAMD